jgi:chaperonin GroEL
MQYQKVKSIAKMVHPKGQNLEKLILDTVGLCAEVVGSTLGPGGMNVLVERQEQNMPPMVTKDGVTVFNNLGFSDSTAQVIMEAARDSAVRTASEAGDGTTTATILANSFVRATNAFCKANPKYSPQRVVRNIEQAFKTQIEPSILACSKKVTLEDNQADLHAVAKVSANGDVPLADAVIECFKLVGDEGNVTLLEFNGPSKYEVERIDGYGIPIGFEDSCGPFYSKFINDPGTQSCQMDNPFVILYFGQIKDVAILAPLFEKIINAANGKVPNILVMATGFSETVLAHLAVNFSSANRNITVFPLIVPMSPIKTGQHDFLQDLASLSGAKIFDLIQKPLEVGDIDDLGMVAQFESTRFRSNIIITMTSETETRIFARVDELDKQLGSMATSQLDKTLLRERMGKLTGGIAKLKIFGSSNGELREKRDRAEDAICAVRGALKHGTLTGGGLTLHTLSKNFALHDDIVHRDVIAPALIAPVHRLFKNSGYSDEERDDILGHYVNSDWCYDLLEGKMVNATKVGLLDSTPAVLEAIRNAISIATLLGTCGGTIVFARDSELERKESKDTREFLKMANDEG